MYVCVCAKANHMHFWHLGPASLQIKAIMWSIFYVCTTLAGHIAKQHECKCCIIVNVWVMNVIPRKGKRGTVLKLTYCYRKASRGWISSITEIWIPSNGQVTINSIYTCNFTSYALWRDLGFNPSILEVLLHHLSKS